MSSSHRLLLKILITLPIASSAGGRHYGALIAEQHKYDIETEKNHQMSFIKLGSKLDKRIAPNMKFSILAQAVIFLNGKFANKFEIIENQSNGLTKTYYDFHFS